jgi:multidrug resistance protein MdtO
MLEVHRQILDRNLPSGSLPVGIRGHIITIAELMDSSAAFGLQAECPDAQLQSRCRVIAEQCAYLARELRPDPTRLLKTEDSVPMTHLERIEKILGSLSSIGSDKGGKSEVLASKHLPLFIPGAASNPVNVAFALKISLCATLCYIIYHAIDWNGISTSVTTIMIAGLVTSGAMKQKLTFRLLGSLAGGLLLGLGAEVLLFPFMESITSLVIVVGGVAFVAAWIGGGPRFSYVGLQVGFAFYLVALSGFTSPTELAPARDRFVGIMLAVIVMWFVFDQIWPVRTVTEMRRVVGSILKDASRVVGLIDSPLRRDSYAREREILRERLARDLSTVRTMHDAAQYEFGSDRAAHIRAADNLMRMSMTAVALVWNHVPFIDNPENDESEGRPARVRLRQSVEQGLLAIADVVQQQRSADTAGAVAAEDCSEYAGLTVARFNELRALAVSFDSPA